MHASVRPHVGRARDIELASTYSGTDGKPTNLTKGGPQLIPYWPPIHQRPCIGKSQAVKEADMSFPKLPCSTLLLTLTVKRNFTDPSW